MSGNSSSKANERAAADADGLRRLRERVQAIIRLRPAVVDEAALCVLLDDPAPLRTQQQVAEVFDQSTNTIQRSWRSNGMPGRAGAWPPVEILAWYLRREASRAERSGANGQSERSHLETENLRALLSIRQAKARREHDKYVPVEIVESVLGGLANRCRDAFQGLPRKYKPLWPERYAAEWSEMLAKDIRHILTMISETPTEDMVRYFEDVHSQRNST